MSGKNFFTLFILLICSLPVGLLAQGLRVSNSGTVAAPFLTISLDPRGAAMGNAATALEGGIQNVIWNPAAIAGRNNSFFISHSDWLADITIDQAGIAFNLGALGTVGAFITTLNYGEMAVRTVIKPEGTGEKFDAVDFSLGGYFARPLTNRLTLGVGIKYIYQRIWHSKSSSVAFDIGTLFKSPILGIDFGVNISNFGADMRLSGRDARVFHDIDPVMTGNNDRIPAQLELDAWPLPLLLRVGVQRRFTPGTMHSFLLTADAYYPQDNYGSLNLGMEYGYKKMFFLRTGYRGMFLNEEGGPTAGFGFAFRTRQIFWNFDVAVADYGFLQNITIFGFAIHW